MLRTIDGIIRQQTFVRSVKQTVDLSLMVNSIQDNKSNNGLYYLYYDR